MKTVEVTFSAQLGKIGVRDLPVKQGEMPKIGTRQARLRFVNHANESEFTSQDTRE